jgi:hypothetical protein
MSDFRSQPMTETTPLPWSVGHDGKTIMGNGGDNFVVYAYATATCGRAGDDFYSCRNPPVESHLSVKPGDAALLVEAVNSHEALKARIQELTDQLTIANAQLVRADQKIARLSALLPKDTAP